MTTYFLADEPLIETLFERHAPAVADTLAGLFGEQVSPLDWRDTPVEKLQGLLLVACLPAFAPVASLTVEDALGLKMDTASPEGYYNWLVSQAAPSWNLDRTRLPDGGASCGGWRCWACLMRPARSTASMSTCWSPPAIPPGWWCSPPTWAQPTRPSSSGTATWPPTTGCAAIPRCASYTQFQTDQERARQAFALASLFRFVTNQGAYFYYHPADQLARPVKLAQGLANALQAFIGYEELVRETWERIEQVVACWAWRRPCGC